MKIKKIPSTKDFNEIWHAWNINTPKTEGSYYIINFGFADEGFKITMEHEKKDLNLEVFFDGSITAFRLADEGCRLRMYDDLSIKHGSNFYKNNTFFKVENSEYLKWLSFQSYETTDCLEIKHFVIMGLDCFIDIAAHFEPEISIIKAESKLNI